MNKQAITILLAALAASMAMTSTQVLADDDNRGRGGYGNNEWQTNNGNSGKHGNRNNDGYGNNEGNRSGKHGNRNNDNQWGNANQGNDNQRMGNQGNDNQTANNTNANNANGKRWWQQ